MTAQSKTTIKSYFETGDKPTQAQFVNLIDSYIDAIASGQITNGYLAPMANGTVKANVTGITASAADVSVTSVLDAVLSSAQGSIAYRGASTWTALTAGTSGQYLQTLGVSANPQWATISSPTAALVFISATAASNNVDIAFKSGIDGTYGIYIIEAYNVVPATDDTYLMLRYSTDSGGSFISNTYVNQNFQSNSSATNITIPTDGIYVAPNTAGYRIDSGATNDGLNLTAKIFGASGNKIKYTRGNSSWFEAGGASIAQSNFTGCYRGGVQAINAIQFVMGAGNITSGNFYLYGVKTS